ncbi:hypothetical protein EB001_15740 [bacterium]|nr:hypothetical protein [bacterium]
MPYIELKVADKGTPAIDFKNNSIHPSAFGHVWYHIYKNENDLVGKSYGFAPDENHQGQPFAPGKVYEDDSFNYTLNEAGGDYIGRVYITEEQYLILDKFGKDPTSNDFGFSKFYSGLSNSCIDFVWTGLAKAGLVTINSDGSFFNGDVIPTWNIDNFQRLINSINNSNIGIPSVPNFQLTTPFSANLTNSQFITTIADYYKLDAVEVVNLNPDYFSNALGYEGAKISAHQGNVSNLLKNSDFTLKDINLSDHINLHQDNKGNDFSIVKDNVLTPLKDGSTATLNTILNTIDSAKAATDAFINQYMHQLTSIFTTGQGIAGLISDVNAAIQRGDAPEQIAKNIALKALVQTVGQEILNSFLLSDADKALFIANPQLAMSADASGHALLQNGVMSQNGQDALNNFANNHPVYNASYLMAVSMATSLLLNADKDWDSQEYTIAAAQATAQVSAQIAVAAAVKAGWMIT